MLAEAWRGGTRQVNLSRLLTLCRIEQLTEEQAGAVGVLAGTAGHDDIVDVAVVEGALRRGDAIVTSNATHIRGICDEAAVQLRIEDV